MIRLLSPRTRSGVWWYILLLSFFLTGCSGIGQVNEHGLLVVDEVADYQQLVKKIPNQELVNLKKLLPKADFDIRYATANNFTGEVVYTAPEAFLCKPAADSLVQVQHFLATQGLSLKILDAYRPYQATIKFFEIVQNPDYAASPTTGSRHNRGCAVDVSLVYLANGQELQMPTEFDNFTEKAGATFMDLPEEAIQNRMTLTKAMEKFGFKQIPSEWWHFDFSGWEDYAVLDIPFEKLYQPSK